MYPVLRSRLTCMFLMSPYSENLSMMSSSCASSWRPFTNTIQPSIAGGGGGGGDGRWERDEKERGEGEWEKERERGTLIHIPYINVMPGYYLSLSFFLHKHQMKATKNSQAYTVGTHGCV